MSKVAFSIKVKAEPLKRKMDSEELQAYLKMCKSGASQTKNGKAYRRKEKHKVKF